jgi:hypothetical protein
MKNKIFNLIVRDSSYTPARIWLIPFLYDDSKIKNPEKVVRKAVRDFLKTEEGKEAKEYACGCFNWGDVMASIPDEYFESYGIIPFGDTSINVEVEHDEVLSE